MLWTVLFQKLKRQPPKASQIYALLDNPKTHRTEKVYLKLKYDSHGYPYFVPIDENIERGLSNSISIRSINEERSIQIRSEIHFVKKGELT